MLETEFLSEGEVATPNLAKIFSRAFFKTSVDIDGDLAIHCEGLITALIICKNQKLLRFMTVFRFEESASESQRLTFVNRLNDEILLVRFSASSSNPDQLAADYYLPYEGGVPTLQIITAHRLFARVVPNAIGSCDHDSIVK